jgi:hypothetical protein
MRPPSVQEIDVSVDRRTIWIAIAASLIGLLLRVGLASRQSLWADEIFSLAMATGHSLEHPASSADPAIGDYVESPRPLPPSAYRAYAEHDRPAAGLARVIRAVRLSDTNPPLYYVLLHGWTRLLGTSDSALRAFSVAWWVACIPPLWSLGRQLGGRRAAGAVVLLFVFAPLSVFYATEGRMYTMLWFFTLAASLLTLRLHRRGAGPATITGWALAAAAGMLTHYFFVFEWVACTAWILLFPGRARRPTIIAAVAATSALIIPWYIQLPEILSAWRVTRGWLERPPIGFHRPIALAKLAASYVSPVGVWWGGSGLTAKGSTAAVAIAVLAAFGSSRWCIFARRRVLMISLWVLAALLGLVVVDAVGRSYTMAVPRYAIGGMPAAFLLIALALRSAGRRLGPALLVLIIVAWIPSYVMLFRKEARQYTPFREVGRALAERARPEDLVLVHSIPVGLPGLARYIPDDSGPGRGSGMASWVERLGDRRVPDSLLALARGRRRIFLVRIHEVAQPAPEEAWLRDHARLAGVEHYEVASVLEFVPVDAPVFGEDPGPLSRAASPTAAPDHSTPGRTFR